MLGSRFREAGAQAVSETAAAHSGPRTLQKAGAWACLLTTGSALLGQRRTRPECCYVSGSSPAAMHVQGASPLEESGLRDPR